MGKYFGVVLGVKLQSADVLINDLPGPLKDVEYLQFVIWVGFGKLCWLLWDPGMGFLWMTGS